MPVSMSANSIDESTIGDGPLLLALLMGNNNNNAAAQALPDTLNPNNFALELLSTESDDEKAIDDTLNPRNINLELIPSQSDIAEASEAGPSKACAIDSMEDGPLLFGLLLNNQNNNNPNGPQWNPISDTLNPKNVALELNPPVVDGVDSNDRLIDRDDEPLLFALMLGQNNDNAAASTTSDEHGASPDTLDPTNIGLEPNSIEVDMSKAVDPSVNGHDGPLFMTLLLNNQNQNQEAAGDFPIVDILNPKHVALELSLPANNIEETNGRHGLLKTSLALNKNHYKFEDTITEAMPVVFKWNSQVHQGRLVPVTGGAKSLVENSADQKSDKALLINTSKLQSASSIPSRWIASDEPQKGSLSDEQLQFWKDNGYLVIPNALPEEQKDLLLKTVHDVAETLAGGGERVQKHSYLPGQESYVHPSGRAIASLTEYAFQPNVEPLKRIQRLGCGIHRVFPAFRKAILTPFHAALAESLGYKDPRIIQSLIIVKTAKVGARVIPHQDGCSGFTNPSSCTTFWYALEDCTTANGCLAVAPGSHRTQPITRRCRADQNERPAFVDLDGPVFAEVEGASETGLPRRNKDGALEYTQLEVGAGSLVLMHGNLMHTSEANHSSKSRVAFNFNIVEGQYEWLEDNYLQPYEGETEFEKLRGM